MIKKKEILDYKELYEQQCENNIILKNALRLVEDNYKRLYGFPIKRYDNSYCAINEYLYSIDRQIAYLQNLKRNVLEKEV